MKRSVILKELYKVLKPWENCMIEKRTAEAVLDRLEELGMLPPTEYLEGGYEDKCPVNEWTDEDKK